VNLEHAQLLARAVQNGWRPDLDRLEALEKVEHMKAPDYREAWGWVHYMLHASADTRQVLLNYVHELRTVANPGSLHERLLAANPDVDLRWLSYVATMQSPGVPFHAPVQRAAMYGPAR
jgi:hypothetical protein